MEILRFTKAILLGMLLACCVIKTASSSKCDRTPEGTSTKKSPPNGNFKLKVGNNPQRYQPGETYNITLERVTRIGVAVAKFTGFYIIAEKDPMDNLQAGVPSSELQLGQFVIPKDFESLAKISPKCDHLVAHSSSFLKSEINVYWKAPKEGSGCVTFKSTVIVHKDVWYSDDGGLSFNFCEDDSDSGDAAMITLDVCEACEEAKYELTFEGLWSRHTHPKDYPDNGWLTKFSDIIGASHAKNFTMWKYGEIASIGLEMLAFDTSTGTFEEELKSQGEHIRTIIKARGISYPNVTGKTFAVFRVDSTHHLVSFVSMIYPSPDWFVGVSGLELCLANGSWVDQKVISLFPYDAGVDSGPTYTSSDQKTLPKEAIRRIRQNQPNDPRSPFQNDEGRDLKPLGRLYITRQKLYEKNCDEEKSENDEEEEEDEENDENNTCATSKWSDWSECDNPCGKGKQTKTRTYTNRGIKRQCNVELSKEQECHGNDSSCRDGSSHFDEDREQENSNQNLDDSHDPDCPLTEWEVQGQCSEKCEGTFTLKRNYKNKHNIKTCLKKHQNIKLEQQERCTVEQCPTNINKKCVLTEWSYWTKCSNKCGVGERVRVRKPVDRQKHDFNLEKIIALYEKLSSVENQNPNVDENEDEEDNEENEDLSYLRVMDIADDNHTCYDNVMVEKEECNGGKSGCVNKVTETPDFCDVRPIPLQNKREKGRQETRWYFNNVSAYCGIFADNGYEGDNNFVSELNCIGICANISKRIDERKKSHSLLAVVEKIDCKLSPWVHKPCNATCGEGVRWRQRSVIDYPKNGGKLCPRKLVHYERCYRECEDKSNPNSIVAHQNHKCVYSEWNPWSPCSKTCGDNAVKIRTRTVLNHMNTHLCTERLEERRCEVMPCLIGVGYNSHYNYRTYK